MLKKVFGGGGSGGGIKFVSGTFTTMSGYTLTEHNVTVEHNLGYVPTGAMLIYTTYKGGSFSSNALIYACAVDRLRLSTVRKSDYSTYQITSSNGLTTAGGVYPSSGERIYGATPTEITFGFTGPSELGSDYSAYLAYGATYMWIVW